MTESQKETLRFYTTNDFLLINGLLWGEPEERIDFFLRLINEDGRAVMKEAEEQGFAARWECSPEEGETLYRIYQKRFPVIDSEEVKKQILLRAQEDIANMMACLTPMEEERILYRNISTRFVQDWKQGMTIDYRGFSSCSLEPHTAENAEYGASDCITVEILAPAGTPAIRMDAMPEVQNEPDEVILAPMQFLVTEFNPDSGKIRLTALPETE